MKDWYVYVHEGRYYTVDTENGEIVRSGPSTARDIAQATMRGKIR
jgi:hypothetical protein